MTRILFLCAGNTCRNPMAEGIFNNLIQHRGDGRFLAESAGLYAIAGDPVTVNAAAACLEIGVDISEHIARPFDAALMEGDCIAVPLTHAYADALLGAGAPRGKLYIPHQSITDPFGGDLECYRHCRDQLEVLCKELMEELDKRDQRN